MNLPSDKGGNRFGVFLGTYDEQLVADVEFRILTRNADVTFVTDTRAYERTSQKILHLNQLFAVDSLIAYFQMQHMRHVLHIRFLRVKLLFFFFQVDAADVTHGDNRADDADHTERVGAGISQCDGVSRIIQLVQRFLSCTQTGSVGYGTVQDTYYHRQVYISIDEINAQCDYYVQCHNAHSKHVQRHTPFLERGEERRPYLQTDAEYK